MGYISGLLVPRGVRRARHPGRAVKRALTPKVVKKARRARHPADNAVYSVQLAGPGSSPGWCGAEEAGCMNVHGAEIDWDQLGRFPYDRTHAEL